MIAIKVNGSYGMGAGLLSGRATAREDNFRFPVPGFEYIVFEERDGKVGNVMEGRD